MVKREDLTFDMVRKVLAYDVDTGVFTWRVRINSRVHVGEVAGWVDRGGYLEIRVHGHRYLAHRLAYFLILGKWPKSQIDHRDGNPANNAWSNLRACTVAENQQNKAFPRDNTSGHMGVTRSKDGRKWQAQIKLLGTNHYLGLFDSVEAAGAAYLAAKSQIHAFQPVPRESSRMLVKP